VSEFIVDCTVLHCSAGTVDSECIHCELHCLVGACGKAAACRTRMSLGLRTLGAWLPSLGTGPTTPAGRATGRNHLALGLPSLGLPTCVLGRPSAHVALG